MSKENKKTLEVYKEKAHLYLANSVEHDKLDPKRAKQKREKLEKLITSKFSSHYQNMQKFLKSVLEMDQMQNLFKA